MVRLVLACSVVALLALTTGCRMCAHPYDYCGPVYTGADGQPCDANVRHGSILSGGVVATSFATTEAEVGQPEPPAELQRQADFLQSDSPSGWTAQRPVDISS